MRAARFTELAASAVAAMWTVTAAAMTRRRVVRDGVRARAPRLRRFPARGRNGVLFVLDHALAPTCLERSLVLQSWLMSQHAPADVVVGVPREGVGERAIHAWVDGHDRVDVGTYLVIHRLAP